MSWLPAPVAAARTLPAPEGWRHTPHFDPFEAHIGPFFERFDGGRREMGFYVDERHTNVAGFAHGGMLMTFADACLGFAIWDQTSQAMCVTVRQQTQFIGPARVGDFVVCRPDVQRLTRELVFVRGDFYAGETLVFSANAVWKMLRVK